MWCLCVFFLGCLLLWWLGEGGEGVNKRLFRGLRLFFWTLLGRFFLFFTLILILFGRGDDLMEWNGGMGWGQRGGERGWALDLADACMRAMLAMLCYAMLASFGRGERCEGVMNTTRNLWFEQQMMCTD